MGEPGTAHVGRKVRGVRTWRGITLEASADLAGYSEGHLSKIERGLVHVDKRSTVDRLANALWVAPAELTGQPLPPANPAESAGHAAVHELRAVVRDMELGDLEPPPDGP